MYYKTFLIHLFSRTQVAASIIIFFFMIYLDSTHIPACSSKVDESHNALKTNNKRIAGSRVLVNPSSKITNLKVFNSYNRSF